MSVCPLCVYLPLLLHLVSSAGKTLTPSLELFGAIGSFVVLPGPGEKEVQNLQHLRWAFGNIRILDYFYNSPQNATFTNFYKDRCEFNYSNGSVTLKDLTAQDQGLYKVVLDLNANNSRVFKLNVMERLLSPSITTGITMVDQDINLTCHVAGGNASSVRWMKDGQMMTNNDVTYRLLRNNFTLQILKAKKSNCGVYTSVLENRVSKVNHSYHLFIHGIPSLHSITLSLSIVALIFGCTVFIGITVSCILGGSTAISLPSHRKILLFLQLASMVSLVVLMAAICFWGKTSGYSGIIVAILVISSLLLIMISVAMCSMKTYCWDWFNNILSTKFCSVMVDVVTPLGGLIVIISSGILIDEILKQAGKGCESPGNLLSSILPAVIVPSVVFVIFFACYARQYTKHKQRMRTNQQVGRNQQRDPVQMPMIEMPGGLISSNVANVEEMPGVGTCCL